MTKDTASPKYQDCCWQKSYQNMAKALKAQQLQNAELLAEIEVLKTEISVLRGDPLPKIASCGNRAAPVGDGRHKNRHRQKKSA